MVSVELVKDFLLNSGLDYGHNSISLSIISLAKANLLKEVGDAAVQLVDEYLTAGNEDSLFSEPEFQKNRDLNAFLKSDKLGKGEEYSPRLREQITMTKKIFRKTAPIGKMKEALAAE